MNLKKRELIISLVMVIVFIILGLSVKSFATQEIVWDTANTNKNTNTSGGTTIQSVNTSTGNTAIVNNTVSANLTNTNTKTNTNTNTTAMPNTGAENLPWAIIAICGVSAIFAYKKIKEYKVD